MMKIVQITDSHLGVNSGDTLLSMNTDESLRHVLDLVKQQQPVVDLVLATGDIANEASSEAYQRFYAMVSEHLVSPFAWLPGNHDKPELMQAIAEASDCRLLDMGQWLIVLLNSQVSGKIYGNISQKALAALPGILKAHADKHVLISFHHQPVPIGSCWMDRYILKNGHAFWATIAPYANVKTILWGHIHQEFDETYKGVRLLASPSTCIQFKPGEDEFTLDKNMPGYRWLELHDDGTLTTQVERVAYTDYGINYNSSGY